MLLNQAYRLAKAVHSINWQAKVVAMHATTLATSYLHLEETKNEKINTELKLQTKYFVHKNMCSCHFAESVGVRHGVRETGAKLAWLHFSELKQDICNILATVCICS